MIEKVSAKEYCQSCGAELYGKFCSQCGEKKFDKSDLSFKKILLQALDVFTHFDSKILRSVKLLITKPGLLAKEYCSGVKVKYAKPLQLFFIINVVYFLAMSFVPYNTFTTPLSIHMYRTYHSRIARPMVEHKLFRQEITQEEYDLRLGEYAKKFDAKVNIFSKSLIIIIVPLLALILQLLFINRRRMGSESFIFALNFLSWLLLYMLLFQDVFVLAVVGIEKALSLNLHYLFDDNVMTVLLYIAISTYCFFGYARFYNEKKWLSIVKSMATPLLFFFVLSIYRFILFLITYYST